DFEERRFVASSREFLSGLQIDWWLLNVTAKEEDQKSGRDADEEQPAPCDRCRQQREEDRIEQGSHSPSNRPARLHRSEGFPAMFSANRFTQKNCACSPLASETEAQQGARDKHLGIV